MTARFWTDLVIVGLAVVGLWVAVDKTAARIMRAWGWWRRDRVTPLLEDPEGTGVLCAGCAGFEHCDGQEGACDCTCGWSENWAEEELPPERSAADLGFMRGYRVEIPLNLLEAETRERRAPWWEAEHRAAYESLGFDYPSGLMARVRELTP